MCLKLAKIGISNITPAFVCLMTYQANLYFSEMSLGLYKGYGVDLDILTCM